MKITLADETVVRTIIDFQDGSTGYISVAHITDGPASYAYMPLRSLEHLKLAQALKEHGQAEVSVRLKSGIVAMIATELSARSITLVTPTGIRQFGSDSN